MTALAITSLSKCFRAGAQGCSALVTVIRDLDLALWPGEIVAIEGERGSGRSTLLACAAGLLHPDAGSIFWFGARVPPRDSIAHVSASATRLPRDFECPRERRGSLYTRLHANLGETLSGRPRLLLVDDLPSLAAVECRLVLTLLQHHARSGAAVLFAANGELARAPVVSRALTLTLGTLLQRRKRSAARIAASSPDSRARASARSTYGRNLRSPQ
jgi:ABC-type cobalamin/Fe3+-siderophores transport system ATPase subunit